MIHFCPASTTFYDDAIPGIVVPAGAIPLTAHRHAQLLDGLASGRAILIDDHGRPQLGRSPSAAGLRRDAAIGAVRREARARILAVASEAQQRNDNAQLALAALQLAAGGATTIDTAGALARRTLIDAIRLASNEAQDRVATMTAAQLVTFDPVADIDWPQE